MKPCKFLLILALFFAPALAHASPDLELVCDPDAKVSFHSHWFRASSVKFEGHSEIELPWTGKELVTSARQLKEERLADTELEADTQHEEIFFLNDATTFLTYRQGGNQQRPFDRLLYIERALLSRSERDGIVVLEQVVDGNILRNQGSSHLTIYHCRSR